MFHRGRCWGRYCKNIGFNSVLENRGDDGDGTIICFADDTLVVATASTLEGAIGRAQDKVQLVLDKITGLGLIVATEKTDVVLFTRKGVRQKGKLSIRIGPDVVDVKESIKYLGVMVDGKLNFKDHLRYIEKKASKCIGSLCGIMPNLRSPGEKKRKLYAYVVSSIIMYASPIWAKEITRVGVRKELSGINKVWRRTAIRVISGYRTISLEVAGLLATCHQSSC